jgi:hypothetical protein
MNREVSRWRGGNIGREVGGWVEKCVGECRSGSMDLVLPMCSHQPHLFLGHCNQRMLPGRAPGPATRQEDNKSLTGTDLDPCSGFHDHICLLVEVDQSSVVRNKSP